MAGLGALGFRGFGALPSYELRGQETRCNVEPFHMQLGAGRRPAHSESEPKPQSPKTLIPSLRAPEGGRRSNPPDDACKRNDSQ